MYIRIRIVYSVGRPVVPKRKGDISRNRTPETPDAYRIGQNIAANFSAAARVASPLLSSDEDGARVR